jgi:D-arabinan exo alpha-(1,3)/(1,5)-arabinofuranosidase (non-reducing end)
MLRRTLDYQWANQRAIVSVATDGGWVDAGVWYTAGSNTVYHSFPYFDGELGASRPRVITSNRRFRDEEFLLPLHLTQGRSEIEVRVEFAPRNPPLLPEQPPQATAWTELAYRVYCFVMPRVTLD